MMVIIEIVLKFFLLGINLTFKKCLRILNYKEKFKQLKINYYYKVKFKQLKMNYYYYKF